MSDRAAARPRDKRLNVNETVGQETAREWVDAQYLWGERDPERARVQLAYLVDTILDRRLRRKDPESNPEVRGWTALLAECREAGIPTKS